MKNFRLYFLFFLIYFSSIIVLGELLYHQEPEILVLKDSIESLTESYSTLVNENQALKSMLSEPVPDDGMIVTWLGLLVKFVPTFFAMLYFYA